MFDFKATCRLCNSYGLEFLFSLGSSPLANNLSIYPNKNKAITYPLDLYQCKNCEHVQLGIVVNPELLFFNYLYASGATNIFKEHLQSYATDLVNEYNITSKDYIVEIASNDGTMLQCFKNINRKAIGVDPAINLAKKANSKKLLTLVDFFSSSTVTTIKGIYRKKPKAIVANNVFAHIDDLQEVFFNINNLLADDGIVAFEVGYLVDVFNKTLFDTIYHEHLSYHTIKPLQKFLKKYNLEIINIIRTESQGGSIRIIAQRIGGKFEKKKIVEELISKESRLDFKEFCKRIDTIKQKLRLLLLRLKSNNKTIIGYGVPAKATTLLNYFNISNYLIYLVDDNKLKQGLYLPNTNLSICNPSKLKTFKPDYILILAWNFYNSIIEKTGNYNYIIPLPIIKVINK